MDLDDNASGKNTIFDIINEVITNKFSNLDNVLNLKSYDSFPVHECAKYCCPDKKETFVI